MQTAYSEWYIISKSDNERPESSSSAEPQLKPGSVDSQPLKRKQPNEKAQKNEEFDTTAVNQLIKIAKTDGNDDDEHGLLYCKSVAAHLRKLPLAISLKLTADIQKLVNDARLLHDEQLEAEKSFQQ